MENGNMEGHNEIKEFTSVSGKRQHLIPRTGEMVTKNEEYEGLRQFKEEASKELGVLRELYQQSEEELLKLRGKCEHQEATIVKNAQLLEHNKSLEKEIKRLNADLQHYMSVGQNIKHENEQQKVKVQSICCKAH